MALSQMEVQKVLAGGLRSDPAIASVYAYFVPLSTCAAVSSGGPAWWHSACRGDQHHLQMLQVPSTGGLPVPIGETRMQSSVGPY